MNLSPLNQRRLQLFRQNKRGFYSFILFLVLFFITLFAEFIANDKPLIVAFEDRFYFPVLKSYPETTFGGIFESETNYKDPVVIDLIEKKGWLLMPLIPFSSQTINYNLPQSAPYKPTSQNWLGTDDQGRDVLARLIYGFRTSVVFAILLTFFSSIIGILAGAIQGYLGGWVDLFFQRIIEIWSGLPMLYILIILASFVEPNFYWLLFIMLLFSWLNLVALVRAEFLRARNFDYVRAARALGVSTFRIIWRHILPNTMVVVVTMVPFLLNIAVSTLASLDFLGFGLPAGTASLGELLSQGKNNIHAPWLGITGFFVVALLLSILIFIGEAARDAIDPKKGIK